MKKIFTIVTIAIVSLTNAQAYKGKGDTKAQVGLFQAYKGKGDTKAQVGLNAQNRGTGINVSTDFGIGENMSYGFVASYLLSVDDVGVKKPKFEDRADVKVRFNANLGNVFRLDNKMDIYPGLSLGSRNFGSHVGFRYFFTEGFGLYTEASVPLARFDSNVQGFDEEYNNQFVFQIGACFNL